MSFFRTFFTFSALITVFVCTPLQADDSSTETIEQHVYYLADDAREGRGIGTEGLDEAADYIAARFEEYGLEPAFEGSYFQPFEMGWGFQLGPDNQLVFGNLTADTSSGIMPLGISAAGTVSGPVVFAGYGIIASEYEYDDFADLEEDSLIGGAIALCLTGEPGEFDSTSKFEGVNYTEHSLLRTKVGNARLKGAVGMLVVEGPLYAGTAEEKLEAPSSNAPYVDAGIPVLRITRAALQTLFPDFELEKLQRSIDTNTAPRSLSVTEGDTCTITADLSRETVTVKNVAGILPGGDSVIVIGAHYDHLGYGQDGSLEEAKGLIHNGADDNASGVAAVLEAARLLRDDSLESTLFFTTFTAEEVGLNGSNHLVKNFPMDIERVRAMINLDMVGRLKNNELTVMGCKSAEEFNELVTVANQDIGLDITCKGDGYGPSDHMAFFLADVPVLFLFTGAHEDYHKASDDADKINYPGLYTCVNLLTSIVREIDDYSRPLTLVKSAEPPSGGPGRFRSSFGSIPDFSQPDTLLGVLISGARKGGAAAEAGLEGGDLLIKMGDVVLNNLYDLVFALRTYAPGDTVEVHFIRDDEEHTTLAVLQSPK